MKYLDTTRVEFEWDFPLAEIILDFYDRLKTISRGYAGLDYELADYRTSELVRLDMLINGERAGRVLGDHPPRQGVRVGPQDRRQAEGADPAAVVRGGHPGGDRQQGDRADDGEAAAEGRAGEVLRRRHHAQAEAPGEAEGGEEADEAGGRGGDSAGGVPGGVAGGLGHRPRPQATATTATTATWTYGDYGDLQGSEFAHHRAQHPNHFIRELFAPHPRLLAAETPEPRQARDVSPLPVPIRARSPRKLSVLRSAVAALFLPRC